MTPAQKKAKVRSWQILRLRGAYATVSNIGKTIGYDPTKCKDEIENMLFKLGAKTHATLAREHYEENR